MIDVLALSLALTLSAAPTEVAPAQVATPTPVSCDEAKVAEFTNPISVDIGGPIKPDYCFEDCDALPDISCSGNTCIAVNRNCSIGERGYVTCDGNTTYCSQPCGDPPPECEEDDFRIVRTGQCCDCQYGGEVAHFQQCQNGQWVTQSTNCAPSSSCPLCP